MLNETPTTSVQWMDWQAVWPANPLDLVNEQSTEKSDGVQWNEHKSIVDKIVWLIAKLTWNPDPFTWETNVSTTAAPKVKEWDYNQTVSPEYKAEAQTQTTNPEIKQESQTNTANNEEWLFGKFSWWLVKVLDSVWDKVENLWDKALWGAVNAMAEWLKKAEEMWDKAIDKAQNVVENTSQWVSDFVKLEDEPTEVKVEENKTEWEKNPQ